MHEVSHRRRLPPPAYERPRRLLGLAFLLLGLTLAELANAQAPRPRADSAARDSAARDTAAARPSVDSLAARLERAEAAVELLRRQLATEASSTVRTRSRLQVELWAQVLLNGFASVGPLNSAEVPTYATDESAPAAGVTPPATQALGMSLRQSRAGASVSVDSVLGGTFAADVELDFFAGGASVRPIFPQPRLRTARFILRWPRTELLLGSDTPLISDLNPLSVASVGVPGFAGAGNLWYWLPQLRVTREIGSTSLGATDLHWALQGAILDPYSGVMQVNEEYGVDAGSRAGRPYLEARLRARWGPDETDVAAGAGRHDEGGEIGVGVHHGWIRLSADSLTTNEAVSADARVGLHHGLELRGEAYQGRALAGLGTIAAVAAWALWAIMSAQRRPGTDTAG